ncbi:MAG TPA: hypothetical protein VFS76_21465 [Pyrinomonadaceae bacterium]|nr:hypothetical protein [Pyrinomonadaceae bacterium]
MSRTILILWLVVVFLFLPGADGLTFAQSVPRNGPTPLRFDEYGNLRGCDHSARLDNFAIQLQNTPDAVGYVVVYAPESSAKKIGKDILDYLSNTRGLERVKTIHAGYNSVLTEPLIQLWVVPAGSKLPKFGKHKVDLETVKGKLAEYQTWDPIELVGDGYDFHEYGGDGPPVGNVIFAAFEDVLKAQKNSVAHVIGFNGVNEVPGAWRRVSESIVESLKRFGFESDRFKIGYGGQSKESKVQLWILPKGENPPTKDPASEPLPKKAIQIGDFDDLTLGEPKNEVVVMERLQRVMRENPGLRACFIVRMEVPDPIEEEPAEPIVVVPQELSEPSEPSEPPEPPQPEPVPADLFKLIEKWKIDIAAKNQNRQDRVVVLFGKAQEYHRSSIEIWVVPPGQPLPDPNAPPADEQRPLLTHYSEYSTPFRKRFASSLLH